MLVFIRTLILMQKASQNIICKNFSIECYVSTQIVNIYAVIMTRKVGLWCFFIRETNEKNLQFNIFESKSM